MSKQVSSVWIKAKVGSEEAASTARRVAKAFERRGVRVYVDNFLTKMLGGWEGLGDGEVDEDLIDLVVIVGGDGTLLRFFHSAKKPLPPTLGINRNRIGFFYDYDWRYVEEAVEKVVKGDFYFQENKLGTVVLPKAYGKLLFVNEVIIGGKNFRLTRLEVSIDGEKVFHGRMDGIIVSTAIGASGHALSAGGPFVDLSLDLLLIVPINPFSPLIRPFVVSASRQIEIAVYEDSVVTVDGVLFMNIPQHSRLRAFLSNMPLRLVRFRGVSSLDRKIKSRLLDVPPWSL